MITRRRLVAAVCGVLVTLTGGLAPTGALADAADTPTKEAPKVELVLDVSGSMRARDIDGQSRMAAAKQAFDEVLDATPQEVRLGIRTLGANYPGDNRQVGCKDTRQLYPVGPLDRTEAKAAVATLTPTGWTPIGPSLLKAADDLQGGNATRRIVLISDGEDTCAPLDPCQVAREIASKGIHLTVDTLGLVPDSKTRSQLSCIAEATGGTYTSVQHTTDLTHRVQQLVNRTTQPTLNPVATQGSAQCEAAPELKAGLYTDREGFGQHRYYRVAVPPGKELRAAVSVAADRPVNDDYGLLLRASTSSGREIVRGEAAGDGRTDVVSTGLRYPKSDVDADDSAGADGTDTSDGADGSTPPPETVCLSVSNSFSAPASVKTSPGLPVELSLNLTDAPHNGTDAAFWGLGHGWWLLLALTVCGFLFGLIWGWVSRWRVAIWRTN